MMCVPPCRLCCDVYAALAKYGKGQSTDDLAEAVEMMIERNLLPRLPPEAQLSTNDFRTERLYTEEVRPACILTRLLHAHMCTEVAELQ
jgi:hypothetical protein